MKKTIITIILLVLSITTASAKTTLNLDSIFANTLAFQARLDTAVYIAPNLYCPINNDPYIGNTYKMYRDAIKCYNMIKNNTMKKKLIPEVIECTLKYYEPYFSKLLSQPVNEVQYYDTPKHIKYYTTVDRYDIVEDGTRHSYRVEKPHYEIKYYDDITTGYWYNLKATKPDGTKTILHEAIYYFRMYTE